MHQYTGAGPSGRRPCNRERGTYFEKTNTPVGYFASGVVFTDFYADDPRTLSVDESGEITWTVTFDVVNDVGFSGNLGAVGAGFSGDDSGCNGTFPTLIFEGGKRNPGTQ